MVFIKSRAKVVEWTGLLPAEDVEMKDEDQMQIDSEDKDKPN